MKRTQILFHAGLRCLPNLGLLLQLLLVERLKDPDTDVRGFT